MVAGGSFTQVNGQAQSFLAAWGAPNGAVSDAIPPTSVNGEVLAIEATPGRNGFYAAGKFSTAAGAPPTSRSTTWSPSGQRQLQGDRRRHDQHHAAGGQPPAARRLLRPCERPAALRPGVGELHDRRGRQLPHGHRNFRATTTSAPTAGPSRVRSAPSACRWRRTARAMIVVGNFTNATTTSRQDHRLRPRPDPASTSDPPRRSTRTGDLVPPDVQQGRLRLLRVPGRLFTRRQLLRRGRHRRIHQEQPPGLRLGQPLQRLVDRLNVAPAWVDFTGTDSLYSVAVTSAAVYVGGHERWLNNPYGSGQRQAGRGAASRHRGARPGQRRAAGLEPGPQPAWSRRRGRSTRPHRRLGRQ